MCFSYADCKVLINDRAPFFVTHTCNIGKILHGLAAKSRATCHIFHPMMVEGHKSGVLYMISKMVDTMYCTCIQWPRRVNSVSLKVAIVSNVF